MSVSARDIVLARIREATANAPDAVPARDDATGAPADIELFVDRLVDYRAVVHRCDSAGTPDAIAAAVRESAATRVAIPAGLDPAWRPAGVTLVDDAAGSLVAADLDGNDVAVITACAVAVAETGTIVLDAGPGQGRRLLSLVPDHHICVVRDDQIVAGVPDAFAVLDPLRPITWISGPSATSDIELRRVEGVHGPRHLIVIVVSTTTATTTRSPSS